MLSLFAGLPSSSEAATSTPTRDAYVTVTTSLEHLNGALALAASIKKWEAARRRRLAEVCEAEQTCDADAAERAMVALVPRVDGADATAGHDVEMLAQMLAVVGFEVVRVPRVPCGDTADACTKLHVFGLAQYRSVLYLDPFAFLVREAATSLFDRHHHLSDARPLAAAPDTILPTLFSSNVLLVRPSAERHRSLLRQAGDDGVASYIGGDQGFLNAVFPDWFEWDAPQRLSPRFNCADQIAVRSGGSFKHYEGEADGVAILHLDFVRRGKGLVPALAPYAEEWQRLGEASRAIVEADPRHPNSKKRREQAQKS